MPLSQTGAVVIAGGGGGVPVVRSDAGWGSVDAVIDKDRASALLAASVAVEVLVLVTGVDQVYVGYGTPAQRALGTISADEARTYLGGGRVPGRIDGTQSGVGAAVPQPRRKRGRSSPRCRD